MSEPGQGFIPGRGRASVKAGRKELSVLGNTKGNWCEML